MEHEERPSLAYPASFHHIDSLQKKSCSWWYHVGPMLRLFPTVPGIRSRVGICESHSGDQGQSLSEDASAGESERYDKVAGLSHSTY